MDENIDPRTVHGVGGAELLLVAGVLEEELRHEPMVVSNHLERYRRCAELGWSLAQEKSGPGEQDSVLLALRAHQRCEQMIDRAVKEACFVEELGTHLLGVAGQWGVVSDVRQGVWNLFGAVPPLGAQRSIGIYLNAHALHSSDGVGVLTHPGTAERDARCALLLYTERWVYDFIAAVIEEASESGWLDRPARLSEWFDVASRVEVDYIEGLWTHRHDSSFRELGRAVTAARRLAGRKRHEAPVFRPGLR